MAQNYKMYLGGEWVDRDNTVEIRSPYDDSVVGNVALAGKDDYTKAIEIAEDTFKVTRELPSYKRQETCQAVADALQENIDELATLMARELGKAYQDAKVEITRAIGVFKIAGEEAKRMGGDIIDLDWSPGSEERVGLVRRFPKGVIAGISPFNFPLNLVCHKVAPAIASGNTIVIKPASATPIMALKLAEIIDKTDHPKGAVSILPGSSKNASPLLEDPRVKLITFTGSAEVGWWIKENAGKKEVVLELGGNAGAIVADDTDLDFATTRITKGGYAIAGQSCISVQRVYVHENVYDEFLEMFESKVAQLKIGDPTDPETDIGAMVDRESVENSVKMIEAAVKGGAKLVIGGEDKGKLVSPTILTDVKASMDVCAKEAFAPLVVVIRYTDFKKAVAEINNSDYGLQAGVFTHRLKDIFYAFKHIDCGGIVINDVPTYRADHQPYGGMKDSGLGREGIRYTIEDMTDVKILSVNLK